MFKSIQYKLFLYTALLIITVAGFTYFIVVKEYVYAVLAGIGMLFSIGFLSKSYKKFNQNILFLLNALDNGDYSFHFSETKLSMRERELNTMLNRIKEILTNARKEVIENEKFLSIIVESVSTGIMIVDDRGIVQMINQGALELFGLPILTHINQLQNVDEHFPELFFNLKSGDSLQIIVANEREEVKLSLHVAEIKMKRGLMKVITLNNIDSELEANEIDSWIRLIRVMTHEIMNSIAPITSLSESLLFALKQPGNSVEEEALKNNTIEAFETINTTASGLISFVESYRKFTSIPKPEIQSFSFNKVVDKGLQLYDLHLKDKGIEVEVEITEPEFLVYADEKLITQVFLNLIKNAIEAIPSGKNEKIIIRAYRERKDKILIDISNSGEPIPVDVLPHIFIPFFTTKKSGSGVGLSISRYIMRLHGGKLQHFLSSEGYTIFQLTL